MDWGIISIPLAVIFFIVTLVLTLKLTKRKQPVWAYKTTKIIGVGTDAPRELKLTFGAKPVKDVYRTIFVLFNRGKEAIRKEDITKNVTIQFRRAEILREPTIKARSKEETKLSAKQVVIDGDNSVELEFLYLDHEDGAVVEVIHTESQEITCTANIIGAKNILNIGEFEVSRRTIFSHFRLLLYNTLVSNHILSLATLHTVNLRIG